MVVFQWWDDSRSRKGGGRGAAGGGRGLRGLKEADEKEWKHRGWEGEKGR